MKERDHTSLDYTLVSFNSFEKLGVFDANGFDIVSTRTDSIPIPQKEPFFKYDTNYVETVKLPAKSVQGIKVRKHLFA